MKAANQGQYRAQIALATAYARQSVMMGSFQRQFLIDCEGCSVDRDLVTAYYWLVVARASTPAGQQRIGRALAEQMAALESRLTRRPRAAPRGGRSAQRVAQ